MLRRRAGGVAAFVAAAVFLVAQSSLSGAFASTSLPMVGPSPSTTQTVDARFCNAHPLAPGCTVGIITTTTTPATPDTSGTHATDTGSVTDTYKSLCIPPKGPLVPADVDCSGCEWSPATLINMVPLAGATIAAAQEQLKTPGSALYRVDCYEPGKGQISTSFVVTTGAPPNPGVPATQLAQEIAVTITTPLPAIHTSPGTESYVGLSTFLWVPAGQWAPVVDSKTDGVKTVTLRAEPYEVKWNTGESIVVCNGPGEPFDPNGPDGQTTSCMHTYKSSSAQQAGLAYKVSATIFFKLAWTCTGRCDIAGGTLNDKQMWSTSLLKVAERQALVTGAGGGS